MIYLSPGNPFIYSHLCNLLPFPNRPTKADTRLPLQMLNSVLAAAVGCEVTVSPAENVIRFGLFELDLKAGQLSRNGTKLRLPQQPLQLLGVLLERPGEVLTREELRQRLWSSDVFVDFDHGLNKSVQKLRDALGDSAASPRYIETIPPRRLPLHCSGEKRNTAAPRARR